MLVRVGWRLQFPLVVRLPISLAVSLRIALRHRLRVLRVLLLLLLRSVGRIGLRDGCVGLRAVPCVAAIIVLTISTATAATATAAVVAVPVAAAIAEAAAHDRRGGAVVRLFAHRLRRCDFVAVGASCDVRSSSSCSLPRSCSCALPRVRSRCCCAGVIVVLRMPVVRTVPLLVPTRCCLPVVLLWRWILAVRRRMLVLPLPLAMALCLCLTLWLRVWLLLLLVLGMSARRWRVALIATVPGLRTGLWLSVALLIRGRVLACGLRRGRVDGVGLLLQSAEGAVSVAAVARGCVVVGGRAAGVVWWLTDRWLLRLLLGRGVLVLVLLMLLRRCWWVLGVRWVHLRVVGVLLLLWRCLPRLTLCWRLTRRMLRLLLVPRGRWLLVLRLMLWRRRTGEGIAHGIRILHRTAVAVLSLVLRRLLLLLLL